MPSITSGQTYGKPSSARDWEAVSKGFTRLVYIVGGAEEGSFLIKPDTDLDSKFKAWGIDWEEWVSVNGWAVEEIEVEDYDVRAQPCDEQTAEARAMGLTALD